MKNLKQIIVLFLCFISAVSFGQFDFTHEVEKVDSINSEYSELAPVFSPDGSKMYFMRLNHPENHFGQHASQDIWCSELKDGEWTKPYRLPNYVNRVRYNAVYGVLADGRLIINGYFSSRTGRYLHRGMSLIGVSQDGTWSLPEPILVKGYKRKSDGDIASVTFNSDASVMIMSIDKSHRGRKNKLYYASKKGYKFSRMKKLKGIKFKKSTETPFLAQNGEVLFYSSNGKNKRNNFDIYQASRVETDNYVEWDESRKIVGGVNSDGFDGFFVVDPSGEFGYFTSQRDGSDNSDIYRIRLKEVDQNVKVKGFVTNADTKEKIDSSVFYELILTSNGDTVELANFDLNKDSAYFEFDVPFGASYELTAIADKYEKFPVVLDFSSIDKAQEFYQDAFLKFVEIDTIATVKGLVKGTHGDYDFISVLVDNQKSESVTVYENGSYSVDLIKGKSYTLIAQKPGYIGDTVEITIAEETEEQKLDLNLNKKKAVAFVDIDVKNYNDSTYIDQSSYEVFLNGMKLSDNQIAKSDNGFELDLEMGSKYYIVVKSNNFIEAADTLDFTAVEESEHLKRDYYLIPIEAGTTVQIENIYFEFASSKLNPKSFIELDKLVQILKDYPEINIEIAGHTDDVGRDAYNLDLSSKRALSVKNYLIEKGISGERLSSVGYGESSPIVKNDSDENRDKNRRVEFVILAKD